MINGKVLWPAYPYKAGFCITDDTDAAAFEQIKTVYDFLVNQGFLTTKTVWPFPPSAHCGIPPAPQSTLRGVTLEDKRYLDYCKMLSSKGFEICLHGASAGNNLRESTMQAFHFLKSEIRHSDTFICHSKNADNIYWNEKITSLFPFHYLLKLVSHYKCSGEVLTSPYFWGDMCHKHINQIRLYRTRRMNTLKKNPSMPYFCPNRPFVNSWFSATKRSLGDCTIKENQERLINENGLTVLYQYLHRYASTDGKILNRQFTDAIESLLSNDRIKVDTVSNAMRRLRQIQGIFIFYEERSLWMVNTNPDPVTSFQMAFNKPVSLTSEACTIEMHDRTVYIKDLPAHALVKCESNADVKMLGRGCFPLRGRRVFCQKIPHAQLYVNLSDADWRCSTNIKIKPQSFFLKTTYSGTGSARLSKLSIWEESSLIMGQLGIIAREILFKGRSISSDKYLDDSREIKLENHDNW
jgi:hypothetical protein